MRGFSYQTVLTILINMITSFMATAPDTGSTQGTNKQISILSWLVFYNCQITNTVTEITFNENDLSRYLTVY